MESCGRRWSGRHDRIGQASLCVSRSSMAIGGASEVGQASGARSSSSSSSSSSFGCLGLGSVAAFAARSSARPPCSPCHKRSPHSLQLRARCQVRERESDSRMTHDWVWSANTERTCQVSPAAQLSSNGARMMGGLCDYCSILPCADDLNAQRSQCPRPRSPDPLPYCWIALLAGGRHLR